MVRLPFKDQQFSDSWIPYHVVASDENSATARSRLAGCEAMLETSENFGHRRLLFVKAQHVTVTSAVRVCVCARRGRLEAATHASSLVACHHVAIQFNTDYFRSVHVANHGDIVLLLFTNVAFLYPLSRPKD